MFIPALRDLSRRGQIIIYQSEDIMAWQDEQPPWGKGGKTPSPEDFIADLLKKLKTAFGGNAGPPVDDSGQGTASGPPAGLFGGLGKLFTIILVIIIFQVVYSSFYTIKPGERGVVLRFGKYSKTAPPGLNFKIPLVDTVVKVDIETVRKEEICPRRYGKIPVTGSLRTARSAPNIAPFLSY